VVTRSTLTAVPCLLLLLAGGCSSPGDPITIRENIVTVENQSSRDWRNVVVTVNDHFRGGAGALAAHGRLTAPLSQFQTGLGQRFHVGRQSVVKIEVAATDDKGTPVKLEWGQKKR